jgi:hypothetical protein
MLRLNDDFIWQFFDKNHFQLKAKANCPPAPMTGTDASPSAPILVKAASSR